jgi:hypothetical protein
MTNCTFMYDNLFDAAVLTPSTQNNNFPVSNIQHRWFTKVWRSADDTGTLTENIVIDLGASPGAVWAFALKKHNFSSSAVVRIQANASDSWGSPSVDVTLSLADLLVYFWSSAQTYRYWRLDMVDSAPVGAYLEIGRLFLGAYFSPSINMNNNYKKRISDPSDLNWSDGGQIVTNQKTRFHQYDISFEYLPPADLAEFETMFNDRGVGREFFFCRDRDLPLTTTIYCRMNRDMEIEHVGLEQFYNVTMGIEELR